MEIIGLDGYFGLCSSSNYWIELQATSRAVEEEMRAYQSPSMATYKSVQAF